MFSDSYQFLFEATPLKNKGFVTEALVAIAIFLKFKKRGDKVFYSDIEKYIKFLRTIYTVGSLKQNGVTIHENYAMVKDSEDKNIKDKLRLKIKLMNRSLEYLMGHPGTTEFDPENHRYSLDFGEEMYSVAAFVNSDHVANYVKKVITNKEKNIIEIAADGLSNNNSVKTDVWVEVDGKKIPMFDFSIKTRNTQQLSQHDNADKKDKQIKFWNDLCGIDVSSYFRKTGAESLEDIDDYFRYICSKMEKQLTTQRADATFVTRLAEGIKNSATLGNDVILLSIDGTTKGKFRTFGFKSFVEALVETGIDLSCKMSPEVNKEGSKSKQTWLKIYDSSDESPSGVLVKIRYRSDRTMTAITIEKGPLLERLTELMPAF